MKKSKLIKVIVFSFVLFASLVSMITLFIFHFTISNVTATFDITSINLTNDYSGVMYYDFTLKNNTVLKIEKCKVEWDIYFKSNDKLLDHYYNVNEIEAKDMSKKYFKYYFYSYKIEGSDIDFNNLTVDDFEIKNIHISYLKKEINDFVIAGCALIPLVIASGGLLLSTLLDKEKIKNIK